LKRARACSPVDKVRSELGKLPLDIGAGTAVVAEGKSNFGKGRRTASMLIGQIENGLKDMFIRVTWISHWLSFSNTTNVVYNNDCIDRDRESILENPKHCNT
jgi:hypothetical protein